MSSELILIGCFFVGILDLYSFFTESAGGNLAGSLMVALASLVAERKAQRASLLTEMGKDKQSTTSSGKGGKAKKRMDQARVLPGCRRPVHLPILELGRAEPQPGLISPELPAEAVVAVGGGGGAAVKSEQVQPLMLLVQEGTEEEERVKIPAVDAADIPPHVHVHVHADGEQESGSDSIEEDDLSEAGLGYLHPLYPSSHQHLYSNTSSEAGSSSPDHDDDESRNHDLIRAYAHAEAEQATHSQEESDAADEGELRLPDALILFYPVLNFCLTPSPSRSVHMADPILPLGIFTSVADAYMPSADTDPSRVCMYACMDLNSIFSISVLKETGFAYTSL